MNESEMIAAQQAQSYVNSYSNANEAMSTIATMTDPSEELHRIEMMLKGTKIIEGKEIQDGDPPMNSKGVKAVMRIVSDYLSRVTFTASVKESDINTDLMMTNKLIARELTDNGREYGIKDKATKYWIHKTTLYKCKIAQLNALYGALNMKEWSRNNVQDHNITSTVSGQRKEGGFFGGLFGKR